MRGGEGAAACMAGGWDWVAGEEAAVGRGGRGEKGSPVSWRREANWSEVKKPAMRREWPRMESWSPTFRCNWSWAEAGRRQASGGIWARSLSGWNWASAGSRPTRPLTGYWPV